MKRPHQTGKRETTLREVVSWIGCICCYLQNFVILRYCSRLSPLLVTSISHATCAQLHSTFKSDSHTSLTSIQSQCVVGWSSQADMVIMTLLELRLCLLLIQWTWTPKHFRTSCHPVPSACRPSKSRQFGCWNWSRAFKLKFLRVRLSAAGNHNLKLATCKRFSGEVLRSG